MSLSKLLSTWRADPGVAGNISSARTIARRQPAFAAFPAELDSRVVENLRQSGIPSLYSHQAAAYQVIRSGSNLVIATGTASGKTLCYNLPVIDHLVKYPDSTALYIFPTKALAQDQLTSLRRFDERFASDPSPNISLKPAIYDGDTASHLRPAVRSQSRIVLTNPDMLHTGILPHHTSWASFFRNLSFIVIDEMHIYRGVFGSHTANVLRRVLRIARHYGAEPRIILTSATIANPVSLAEKLIEAPVTLIDQDGSARGSQVFWLYNPPIINPELGIRRGALQESIHLADDLFRYGIQTAIFTRSRRSVELLLTYLRDTITNGESAEFPTSSPEQAIRGYRSGYLPHQRREIELGLRTGRVRSVVATNALELGVDIGAMGAVIMAGYPGSIAATWQQAGRAGRTTESSLAILILTADPLDQYLSSHPEYFFERPVEQVLINPDNLLILLAHLRCAAFELPFTQSEGFGSVQAGQVKEFLDFLAASGEIHASGQKYFWVADQFPAASISLRTASTSNILLQVNQEEAVQTIGEIDQASALWMVHPQAVYLHEGQPYHVDELDLEQHIAHLSSFAGDYYTEPRQESQVQLVELQEKAEIHGGTKNFGEIQVTTQVIGYRKINWFTHEMLGTGLVDLPSNTLNTTGYWLALSNEALNRLRESGLWRNDPIDYGAAWPQQRRLARQRDGFRCQVCGIPEQSREHDVHHRQPFRTFTNPEQANQLPNLITLCPNCHHQAETIVKVRSGLGGLSYLLGHLAPLFLMCDSRDLGVHADPQSPLADGQPAIVIYDLVPAGIGLSKGIYEIHPDLLDSARERILSCPCGEGCPSCVGPGGELGMGGKPVTLAILDELTHPS